jgi:hypothetical protein
MCVTFFPLSLSLGHLAISELLELRVPQKELLECAPPSMPERMWLPSAIVFSGLAVAVRFGFGGRIIFIALLPHLQVRQGLGAQGVHGPCAHVDNRFSVHARARYAAIETTLRFGPLQRTTVSSPLSFFQPAN